MVWLNLTMLLGIPRSSNSCELNTQIGRNLVFLNSLFCTCIPILLLCISYPCVVRILQFKRALTELLLLQIVVKENLVWFVLLLRRCVPPQFSCSNDGRVHHSRDPLSRLSFATSDLLPRRRQPWQLHYHNQPSRWPQGLHGSAREVALFCVCLRYALLNITCYFIVLFTIRLWVSSKLMVKLEFLNGSGVHIWAAISTICLLSG